MKRNLLKALSIFMIILTIFSNINVTALAAGISDEDTIIDEGTLEEGFEEKETESEEVSEEYSETISEEKSEELSEYNSEIESEEISENDSEVENEEISEENIGKNSEGNSETELISEQNTEICESSKYDLSSEIIFDGHRYKISNGRSWLSAKTYCEGEGGHLVTINSKDEQIFIEEIMYQYYGSKNTLGACWLGGVWKDNGFAWVTGEPFDYNNWNTNEPNGNGREPYIIFNRNGTWNDGKSGSFLTVCEWDGIDIDEKECIRIDVVDSQTGKKITNSNICIEGEKYNTEDAGYLLFSPIAGIESIYIYASANGYNNSPCVSYSFVAGTKIIISLDKIPTIPQSKYICGKLTSENVYDGLIGIDEQIYKTSGDMSFSGLINWIGKNVVAEVKNDEIINVKLISDVVYLKPNITISSGIDNYNYSDEKYDLKNDIHTINIEFEIEPSYIEEKYIPDDLSIHVESISIKAEELAFNFREKGALLWFGYDIEKKIDINKTFYENDVYSIQIESKINSEWVPDSINKDIEITVSLENSNNDFSKDKVIHFHNYDLEIKESVKDADEAIAKIEKTLNTKSIVDLSFLAAKGFSPAQIKEMERFLAIWIANIAAAQNIPCDLPIDYELFKTACSNLGLTWKESYINKIRTVESTVLIEVESSRFGEVTLEFYFKLNNYYLDDDGSSKPYAQEGYLFWCFTDASEVPEVYKKKSSCGILTGANVSVFYEQVLKVAEAAILNGYDKLWGKTANAAAKQFISKGLMQFIDNKYGSFSKMVYKLATEPAKRTAESITRCPVDLYVYNDDGELCCAIIDDIAYNYLDEAYCIVDEKGKRVLYYNNSFQIKFVGTNEGSMNHEIIEYCNNECVRILNYSDIPLTDSLTYYESVPDFYDADVSFFDIYKEDGSVISANEDTSFERNKRGDVLPEDIPSDGIIPSGLWITDIEPQIYTGSGIKPEVRVYDGNKLLKCNVDYTISYKNNIKVNDCTNVSATPTIIVSGKGNYSGKETQTFSILPFDILSDEIIVSDITVKSNGIVQKPIPTVKRNGKKLKNKCDYTISYPDNQDGAYVSPGDWKIIINGINGYQNKREVILHITEAKLMNKVSVSKIPSQSYTGEYIYPEVSVCDGKTKLIEGTDFLVEYTDNLEIGKAKVILTGIGIYEGKKIVFFDIKGTPISSFNVTGLIGEKIYNGTEIEQTNIKLTKKVNGELLVLEQGKDFCISYSNNIDVGNATLIIKGINSYYGTIKKTYKIKKYDIEKDEDGFISIDIDDCVEYSKGGAKPIPVIKYKDKILVNNRDYILKYCNNNAIYNPNTNTNKKIPTVIIQGKGNYKGTRKVNFAISKKNINKSISFAPDKTYVSKTTKNAWKSIPTVIDNNKKLVAGNDYETTINYYYINDTELMNGVIRKAGDEVQPKDHVPANTLILYSILGKGNYDGELSGQYRVSELSISNAKVVIPVQVYSGKPITLTKDNITIKIGNYKLTPDDYEILYYSNNINKGTAEVTLKGVGNYGKTITVKFKIKSKTFLWWWKEQ